MRIFCHKTAFKKSFRNRIMLGWGVARWGCGPTEEGNHPLASIEKFPTVDMSKLEATFTAEAVKQEFESAMKEFEAMGAELISAAKRCESLGTDVQNIVRETAEAYRQEGKKIFNQIEASAAPRAFARPAKMLNSR